MPRRAKPSVSKATRTRAQKRRAEPPPLDDRIVERPDGFYWESKEKRETYGPFATLAEAQADMLAGGAANGEDEEVDSGGALHEAESDLGINDWIDPDTGGPAEDNVPHIEDH